MGWVIRKGVGEGEFDYAPNTSEFTIKLYHGANFEHLGYIDYCSPEDVTYLSVIEMARQIGCNEVKKIFFKRNASDFETDALELRCDEDAKELGKFALSDVRREVEVFCQTIWLTEGLVDTSSDDDPDYETASLESFTGSDEELRKDEKLVDVPVVAVKNAGAGMLKVRSEPIDLEKVDRDLNAGYISDTFNSNCGSDEEDANVVKYPRFTKTDLPMVKFQLGMLFPTGDEFKEALVEYAISNFKDVKFKKNSSEKLILHCGDEKCPWYMYVAKLPGEETVQIRTLNEKHTCKRARTNRHLKPRYIAKKFLEMIRLNPTWPNKNFVAYVGKALEYKVDEFKGFRALKIAKLAIQGSSAEQYNILFDYVVEIERSNPGTTVDLCVNGGRFTSIYICWAALKKGFIEGCRPVVGLDGCHLTGPHKGVLLTAVAIDANDCMFPFAYAVVDVENYKTWKWFIRHLRKDLNIMRDGDYTFISDKQKGLIKAMEKLLPNVEHRFCVRHLYNNFKQEHKGLVLKDQLWKIARASTMQHFNEGLEEMKAIDPLAYDWVASRPGDNWSRSHFSEHFKCNLLLNNLCESFNAAIKPARCKPILSMLEDIRVYLMTLVMKKKLAMSRKDCELCPKIQEKIEKLKGLQHQYHIFQWG